MRLRMLVGRFRFGQLAGEGVDVIVALARAVDAVGPVQAGVEPLRRIRRAHLRRQHVAQLIEEGLRILFGIEVAAFPAPVGPGAGETIENLFRGLLADVAVLLGKRRKRVRVGDRAPQERGDGIFLDLLQAGGDAGLAEIFLRQNVGRDLRPEFRNLDIVELEDHRAVRVADLAGGKPELDARVGRLSVLGIAALNSHVSLAPNCRTVENRPFASDGPVPIRRRCSYSFDPPQPHLSPVKPSALIRHRFVPGLSPRGTESPYPKRHCPGAG